MRILSFVLVWVRRLPALFTVFMLLFMTIYLVVWTQLFNVSDVSSLSRYLWSFALPVSAFDNLPLIKVGTDGVVVVALLLTGVLASYNLTALCYRHARRQARVTVTDPLEAAPGSDSRLKDFNRIGIILAGGGAKGAYQAGAMKAIYEFLEQNGALDKVRMIAGTSIGSWNSMFWLADLVKSRPGEPSVHESWWRSLSVDRLVEFDYYLPLHQNHFLKTTPWQEGFAQLFIDQEQVHKRLARLFYSGNGASDPPIHFYFTRSNVALGQLEFATNWPGVRTLARRSFDSRQSRQKLVVDPDRYEVIEGSDTRGALLKTRRAVFASMDLPPLFPYIDVKVDSTEWFEDGGVVDNLPVWFGTQIEQCDLLFILPLNASFAEPVNRTSISKRLFRVMDVRQGVLERNSLKLAYLYNELAAARNMLASRSVTAVEGAGDATLEHRVVARESKPVSVFAICPDQPLVIGTAELWKSREAGDAFELMYAATKFELIQNFEQLTDPNWIRMVLVRPQGDRVYVDNF
jgi:predicted acylesterase/phospholipase RssA